jgi:hypothetical protein
MLIDPESTNLMNCLLNCVVFSYRSISLEPTNKLRGPYSASELYRLSDRHLSKKFSADFCG